MTAMRFAIASILLFTATSLVGCSTASRGDPFATNREEVRASSTVEAAGAAIYGVFSAVGTTYGRLTAPPPGQYARALADESATADDRRVAVDKLVAYSFGKQEPYTDAYAQLIVEDPDPLVRATSVRAINRSGDTSHANALLTALEDAEPIVRQEAAKALAGQPFAEAAGPLLSRATDDAEDRDVRLAAIDALHHYDNDDLARQLAGLLEADDFSIAWQARRTLVTMRKVDFQYEPADWVAHIDANPVGS